MGRRTPNPLLVKIHRNYTVEEVAECLKVHKNTVRNWIKEGLPVINDRKPMLILGQDLRDFLMSRSQKRKRPCRPGELYCVRCRSQKIPAGNMVDYQPKREARGNLFAFCPDCDAGMNRYVSLAQLERDWSEMDILITQG